MRRSKDFSYYYQTIMALKFLPGKSHKITDIKCSIINQKIKIVSLFYPRSVRKIILLPDFMNLNSVYMGLRGEKKIYKKYHRNDSVFTFLSDRLLRYGF